MTMQNPWAGFLEEEPRAGYFSFQDRFGGPGRSQRQQNYYTNSFTDMYNQYLGRLGQQVRGGQAPTEQWQDYLGGMDFDEYYRRNVPYETRTQGRNAFAPRTRWMV